MGLMDILQRYVNTRTVSDPKRAEDDFDEVSAAAPPAVLGQGVGDAFRSDQTPPFAEMVSSLIGFSNPVQRVRVINQLLRSIGPGVRSVLGGGALGRMPEPSDDEVPELTPEQAAQLAPEQVREIAKRAEEKDPGVLDTIGRYYAEQPQLVKTLGTAALAIALAGVASRMRR
jgi:hypothetical protein